MSIAFCAIALPVRFSSCRVLRTSVHFSFARGTYLEFWKRHAHPRLNAQNSSIPLSQTFLRSQACARSPDGTKGPLITGDDPSIHLVPSLAPSISSLSAQSNSNGSNSDFKPSKPDVIDTMREFYESLPPNPDIRFKQITGLISQVFPFPLDEFQVKALHALCRQSSVVLSAPTGAGKTVIGEMAIYLALIRGQRVFYTTPLKALSNQKFNDCKRLFGSSRVGLLTGDISINRDADIIVMTTEIYRNMLYTEAVEASEGPPITDKLFAVVFDEFHYLNDQDRGTVWEESIISSPPHVLLVALSATMSNVSDVCEWFLDVQGPTALVQSHVRPVPLKFGYCDSEGIIPLFAKEDSGDDQRKLKGFARKGKDSSADKNQPKMHPKLLRRLKARSANTRPPRNSSDGERSPTRDKYRSLISRRENFSEIPSFPYVVRNLRKRDMLPCIFFIFSRAGCDKAAEGAGTEREELLTLEEAMLVQGRLEAFVAENPDMVQQDRIKLALKGIASHHAGLLPLWKLCIEELFQDGLIKVVFATETLAAGINMPARTTVISALSKRAGEQGFRALTTSEVLQMAGRAGRRGKDVVGHSIILRSRHESALEAFKVLTAKVDALESKFSPSYGMVLNLLLTRPLNECKRLVDRSFGNFLRRKQAWKDDSDDETGNGPAGHEDIQKLQMEKMALETVLEEARRIVESSEDDLRSFVKALERVKAEKRALGYLVQQSTNMDSDLIEDTLTFAPAGTRLLLREKAKRSRGAERREKRRDYSAAIKAAAAGDKGSELMSFYLEEDETELEEALDADDDGTGGVVEAVLLDMHSESIGTSSAFIAADVYGQLRMFDHTAVERIFYDEDAIDSSSILNSWEGGSIPSRSQWRSIAPDQYVAPLPSGLNDVINLLKEWRDERTKNNDEDSGIGRRVVGKHAGEIELQRKRVEEAIQCAKSESVFVREDLGVLLAARRAIFKIEGTLDGSIDPFGAKRKKRRGRRGKGRYAVLKISQDADEGKETETPKGIDSEDSNIWEEFMALVNVLQHYGFIDSEHAVTAMGENGAKVRSENELWTSVITLQPELVDVSPVHLGAILGATQMDTSRSDAFIDHEVSAEVRDMVDKLMPVRTRMLAVQSEFGADVGVALDAELMGIVELWATGVSWVDLLRATSLQEGDVCRIIRRTLDILRQILHLPMVPSGLKLNARRAIALLDRFPVTDDRTYWVSENDRAGVPDE